MSFDNNASSSPITNGTSSSGSAANMVPTPITNGTNGTNVSDPTPSNPPVAARAPRDGDYTVILVSIVYSIHR